MRNGMKRTLPTGKFRKDLKRIAKRGWDVATLNAVISLLQMDADLPENARPHKLSGEYQGNWECYMAPDWLLIYDMSDDEILLVGTGTHADLFE